MDSCRWPTNGYTPITGKVIMMDFKVTTNATPSGEVFQYVYIGDRWTGFMRQSSVKLSDDEVIGVYFESEIVWQDVFSYGSNYTFGDIDLQLMRELGGVALVCESNEDDEDTELENTLRVVKHNYDPSIHYEGFSR